jgi:hypothetical protein
MPYFDVTVTDVYAFRVEAPDEDAAADLALDGYRDAARNEPSDGSVEVTAVYEGS